MKVRHIAGIERLEPRRLLSKVGLDVSFANGGTNTQPAGTLLQLLPDNKILVVGGRQNPNANNDSDIQQIASRLNPDGTLDTSFGDKGELNFGSVLHVLFADSRFYAVDNGNISAIKTDGTADNSFGSDGTISVGEFTMQLQGMNPTTNVNLRDAELVPGGGLIVTSHLLYSVTKTTFLNVDEIARIKLDGSLDTTFGTNGFIVFQGQQEPLTGPVTLAVNSGGFYLSSSQNGGTLTHYTLSGAIDNMFGTQGSFNYNFDLGSIALQTDGKVLLTPGATVGNTSFVLRLKTNGSPDNSFGTNGKAPLLDHSGKPMTSGSLIPISDGRIFYSQTGIYGFDSSGAALGAPFDASIRTPDGFPLFARQIILDSTGKLVVGSVNGVTRLGDTQPVEMGRDGAVYVNGTDANDTVTAVARPHHKLDVTLNGTTTTFDSTNLTGFGLRLFEGDNSATISVDRPATVNSGAGKDTILTAGGDDSVVSGAGSDSISTGAGDDTIFADSGDDVIDCGRGNDRIDAQENDTTSRFTITGGDGNKNITYYSNGAGNVITLGIGDSVITTGGGSTGDIITIAGGNNTVNFGSGTLTIGGSGNNKVDLPFVQTDTTVNTGDGNDTITAGGPGSATINGNGGNDQITVDSSSGSPMVVHGGVGNDSITAGTGRQSLYGDGGADTIHGRAGSDLLSGGNGNDQLFGEGGGDRLYGGDGDDSLYGGAANDRLYGQDGRDHLYGGTDDDLIDGGASGDWLYSQGGNDELLGQGGNDRLYADYSTGIQTLHGGAGSDIFVTKDDLVDHVFGDGGHDSASADKIDVLSSVESA